MQSQAQHNPPSRVRQLLAALLIVLLLIFGWSIFQAYHAYSIVASVDTRDADLRKLTQADMNIARTWTAIVAVCGFFAGISIVITYGTLRGNLPFTKREVLASESLGCRLFILCGLATALVTAAFGALCCYVGYHTTIDVLDFKAMELGKMVLRYSGVNLTIWICALSQSRRSRKSKSVTK